MEKFRMLKNQKSSRYLYRNNQLILDKHVKSEKLKRLFLFH